jgi:murein DD-endopeptidase MepM/ murein hydrolase activator NlpD
MTSAAWIVFGGTWFERAEDRQSADESSAPSVEEPGGVDGNGAVSDLEDNLPANAPPPEGRPGANDPRTVAGGPIIPVEGIAADELTDTFLDARGGGRVHEGIDIMAPTGTRVVAMAPGTVAKLYREGPGGNSIYVRSPDRLQVHYYAHLDAYAPSLREGQQVRAGQQLGTVGSSGNADPAAPHLHLEIMRTSADASWWEPSNAVNPYPILREARTVSATR